MKIGLYSPYLDTAGGGEKYILSIADAVVDEEVDFLVGTHLYQIDVREIIKKIEQLHGLNLSKVNLIKAPIGPGSSFLKRYFFLEKYDFLFYLTDGSVFFSSAKRSIIHFQVPFQNPKLNLWQKIKLSSFNRAIFNSNFTKEVIEKTWPIKGQVIYPPVDTKKFKALSKKKQIISVGRFFSYLKNKKHSLLISAFKNLVENKAFADYSLHLVGVAGEGDRSYLEQLKTQASNLAIFFYPNASLDELSKLYGESKVYWHAAGYEEQDPEKFEHFGISTVEAMAAGCIPVVINKGGQREIVDKQSGYLWNDLDEMESLTIKVLKNPKLAKDFSAHAQKKASDFDKTVFQSAIKKLIYG